ncbi:MAG TPA: ankyrin repeat domain-containing protein [bacterium]|nr:ankyrin repeat domain-containing protein [bacterium]
MKTRVSLLIAALAVALCAACSSAQPATSAETTAAKEGGSASAGATADKPVAGAPKTQEEIDEFVSAAREGDLNAVKAFYNTGGDINKPNARGQTALMWAAQRGHLEVVKFLVQLGANANAADTDRQEPVLMWATKKGHKAVVEFLIASGSDVNQGDQFKETPLMDAARYGHKDLCELLLNKRARVNDTDVNGESALMWAAANGHAEVVKYLISYGADINRINYKTGETALGKAKNKGFNDIVAMMQRQAQVEGNLIKRPPRPEDKDYVNEPPDEKELARYWGGRESALPEQLDAKVVGLHMNSFIPNITQCYQERINQGDKNLMGQMWLKVRVAGSGKIIDIYFETEKYQSSLFGDCILDAIRKKDFPMFYQGLMEFKYSYTL